MAKYLILLVFLVIPGCGQLPPKLPGQDLFVDLIWHRILQRKEPPPRIHWVLGPDLDCSGGNGFYINDRGKALCVAGLYQPITYEVFVSKPDNLNLSETCIFHEFNHAVLQIDTSDPDPTHSDPSWAIWY